MSLYTGYFPNYKFSFEPYEEKVKYKEKDKVRCKYTRLSFETRNEELRIVEVGNDQETFLASDGNWHFLNNFEKVERRKHEKRKCKA